jgi:serine protease DegQ
MIKKLWLTFSQALAIVLAFYLMTHVLRPEWIPQNLQNLLASQHTTPQGPEGYKKAVEIAMPAVVNIYTARKSGEKPKHPSLNDPELRRFFGEDGDNSFNDDDDNTANLGSGVIVSAKGYIVTNQHVVEDAETIEVGLNDGRRAPAQLVGNDLETDLAVLKVNLSNLPVVEFAPEDAANVGDVVLAMGNPFGVGQTVTMGIISALGRNHVGINTFENFIQTDAAINPGNSGGALVNTAGQLLGLNTAIYSKTGGSLGIGFSIPSKTVQAVLNQIIRNGAVTRGYIGVEQQNITEELAKAFNLPQQEGVVIAGIVKDGPADKAGIKVGDILQTIDQEKIKDTTQMLNIIASFEPGQKKQVHLIREGKNTTLQIEIGTRPKPGDLLNSSAPQEAPHEKNKK